MIVTRNTEKKIEEDQQLLISSASNLRRHGLGRRAIKLSIATLMNTKMIVAKAIVTSTMLISMMYDVRIKRKMMIISRAKVEIGISQ